jgi:octaprenyl-diphosphate synthase
LEVGNAEQKLLIREAIETGDAERFDEVNRAIVDTGALQYTIDQAQSESTAAKREIASLEDSEYKQALVFLADYAVERRY